MEIATVLERLEKSDLFTRWKQKNRHSYLSTFFAVVENKDKKWQVGFYDPKEDVMTSFVIDATITMVPPENILKTAQMKVRELTLPKVKIDADTALETAAELQETKYSGEMPVKRILILQHLDIGQVYNITYVTRSFKTLNIKIDAATGTIVHDELISLVRFEK